MEKALSAGAIKDLAYVTLCYGLIKTAVDIDEGSIPADGAIKRESYRASKRLNRRMTDLSERLNAVMRKYSHEVDRVRVHINKLFTHTETGTIPTQLDYLGVFVYLLRFYERKKPVMEDFRVISERELYDITDLMESTNAKNSESEMYKLAYKMVELI